MKTIIKFVLIEKDLADHSIRGNQPDVAFLVGYSNKTAIFSSEDDLTIDQAFAFENYDHAQAVRCMLWDIDRVETLIAIWDSRYPDEIIIDYGQKSTG